MRDSMSANCFKKNAALVARSKKRRRESEEKEDEDVIRARDVLTDSDSEVDLNSSLANSASASSGSLPITPKSIRTERVLPKPSILDDEKEGEEHVTRDTAEGSSGSQDEDSTRSMCVKLTYNSAATKQAMEDSDLGGPRSTRWMMVKKSTLDSLKRENRMLKEQIRLNWRSNENARREGTSEGVNGVITAGNAPASNDHPSSAALLGPGVPSSRSSNVPAVVSAGCPLATNAVLGRNQDTLSSISQPGIGKGSSPSQLLTANLVLEKKLQTASTRLYAAEQRLIKLEEDKHTLALACLEFARLELATRREQELKSSR